MDRAFEIVKIDISDLQSLNISEFQVIYKANGDSLTPKKNGKIIYQPCQRVYKILW